MSRFKPRPDSAIASFLPAAGDVNQSIRSGQIHEEQIPLVTRPNTVEAGEERPTVFQTVGLFVLFAYMVSGLLNDFLMRIAGTKAYVSILTLALLPLLLIVSGGLVRGLQHRVGWLWLGFFAWMVLATPFSFYRRGSVDLLLSYGPRSYLIYFYIAAFAFSVASITRLMYVQIGSNVMLLLSCWTSGVVSYDGRFRIAESSFWSNSNDLALALLIGAVQFVYLFYSRSIAPRIIGAIGIVFCLFYMSRTGSRAGMIAFLAVSVTMFFVTRRKAVYLALAVPCALAFFLFASRTSLSRLLTLSTTVTADSAENLGAIASQTTREHLFLRSLEITLQHPLFGVGPDEFAGYEFQTVVSQGRWDAWVGTHNSYTQVSSECGIPAFLCYTGVLVICLSLAYRMYRHTRDKPSLAEINRISFVLAASLMVYAVATFFFHMAYTGLLPWLAGTTVALYLASRHTFASEGIKLFAK